MQRSHALSAALAFAAATANGAPAESGLAKRPLAPADLFELELAADPQIAPDGRTVAYMRRTADRFTDRWRAQIWLIDCETGNQRPLLPGTENSAAPRWSPDGTRIAFIAASDGHSQIRVSHVEGGATYDATRMAEAPGNVAWSRDGKWLAFTAFVEEPAEPFVEMPKAPEGATWAKPPVVIRDLAYRSDGQGYLRRGHEQLFIVPSAGGMARALTSGPFDVQGPLRFGAGDRAIFFSSNRRADAELEPQDTEIFGVTLADGVLAPVTDRRGPDGSPALSRDGSLVAYVGFDDRRQGYQVGRLSTVSIAGGAPRQLAADLDRDVDNPVFGPDNDSLLFLYDDRGTTKLGRCSLAGDVRELAADVGGQDLGRPYSGGSFSAADNGAIAYTATTPEHPADIAYIGPAGGSARRLTALNEDVAAARILRPVEELVATSSADQRPVQAWYLTPPGFDPAKKYPLILEIHGGPFANYGPRFSYEFQVYAAAGYVVLYANPRGSTSYGEEFGNLIHHAYPSHDYDDLMSCVDALLAKGFVDEARMYVTGGSGGGLLTAWIVGKNDRFAGAVAAKPVIDWTSHVLTADSYPFFVKYWFPAPPWEQPDHYFARSPLSLVGNVVTPTMLLTGEEDWRTPISQAEEYYQALKLRGVDAALVRVPDSSHALADRPSQLIAKVLHILKWFERHGGTAPAPP